MEEILMNLVRSVEQNNHHCMQHYARVVSQAKYSNSLWSHDDVLSLCQKNGVDSTTISEDLYLAALYDEEYLDAYCLFANDPFNHVVNQIVPTFPTSINSKIIVPKENKLLQNLCNDEQYANRLKNMIHQVDRIASDDHWKFYYKRTTYASSPLDSTSF
jgi:hypothetical protein